MQDVRKEVNEILFLHENEKETSKKLDQSINEFYRHGNNKKNLQKPVFFSRFEYPNEFIQKSG